MANPKAGSIAVRPSSLSRVKAALSHLADLGVLVEPSQEAVYQGIVERDIHRLGLGCALYPVGSAANFSLLYILLRAAQELSLTNVVELGAGQSTLLLHHLKAKGVLQSKLLTIEHDPAWARMIGRSVAHEIRLAPLTRHEDAGLSYTGYDLSAIEVDAIDLLLIDGPPAGVAGGDYARHAALKLLPRLSPGGFVVVLDDSERPGEALLADRVQRQLSASFPGLEQRHVRSNKRQTILAAGSHAAAAYY